MPDVKLKMIAEDIASEVVKKLQTNVKGLGTETETAGDKVAKTKEKFTVFGMNLNDLWQLAEKVGRVFQAAFRLLSESMRSAAESGDKNAQIIVSAFSSAYKSVDKISIALAKDAAPAISLLSKEVNNLAGDIADWVDENDIGKRSVLFLVDASIVLLKTIKGLAIAYEEVKISLSGLTGLIGPLGTAIDYLSESSNKFDENIEKWRQSKVGGTFVDPKSWHETSASIQETIDRITKLRGELESASGTGGTVIDPKFFKSASDEKKKALDHDREQMAVWRERELSNASDDKQKQLDILKKYLNDIKLLWGENSTEVVAAGTEINKAQEEANKQSKERMTEANKAYFEASKALTSEEMISLQARLSALQDGSLTEEEIRTRALEIINYEIDRKKQIVEEEKEIDEQKREIREAETEYIENRLVEIENLIATEEEINERKIAFLKSVADSTEASTERQAAAEKKLSEEKKKQSQFQVKDMQERMSRLNSILTSGVNLMLNEHKSFFAATFSMVSQSAKQHVDILSQQVVTELGLMAKMTAGEKAEYVKQALSAKGSIPAKIAAALASLGPLAPVAAAALTAIMFALIDKLSGAFLKLQHGGEIMGRGMGDRVQVLSEPGEIMMRNAVTRQPGARDFLLDLNESGDMQGALARSGAAVSGNGGDTMTLNLNIALEVRGGVLLPRQAAYEVGSELIPILNDLTQNHGYHLYSTGLLRTNTRKKRQIVV